MADDTKGDRMSLKARMLCWARRIKRDLFAVWIAVRDRRTPWVARIIAAITVTYAFSPIDLIPDFIPILGYLDDVVLVPLGLLMAIRLIPNDLMAGFRERARKMSSVPRSYLGIAAVLGIWALMLFFWLPF